MLLKDKSDYTHVWLDSTVMIKVFKAVNNRNPEFMRDIFEQKSKTYNLRCGNDLMISIADTKTKKYGIWAARFNDKC